MEKHIFSKTLKRSFWCFYDNLGFLIVLNVIASILSFTIFLCPFILMSFFYIARMVLMDEQEKISIKEYFKNLFNNFFRNSISVGLIAFFIFLVAYNVFFYSHAHFENKFFGLIFMGISVWALIIFTCAILYVLPLLECKDFYGIKNVSKAVIAGVLKFPFATLGVLVFLIAVNIVFVFSLVGAFILALAFNVLILVNFNFIIFNEIFHNQKSERMKLLDERNVLDIFKV